MPDAPAHAPIYRRRRLGLSPVFGRQLWGYTVSCTCRGFEERVNGRKREAERAWRAHRNIEKS